MSERKQISLVQGQEVDGQIVDQHGQVFDTTAYSRFKHGDGKIARVYGHQMAELLQTEHGELFTPDAELVVATVYKNVPIGSTAIADDLYDSLNNRRALQGKQPIEQIIIRRKKQVAGDYGKLSDEERARMMAGNNLYVDPEVVKGKHLLIVEDARVTGKTEEKIARAVEDLGILSVWFLYVVSLDEETARLDATVEARMNHAYVKDLATLAEVINTRNFLMNVRVCKFILSYNNHEELDAFLRSSDPEFLYSLYTSLTNDGFVQMDEYHDTVTLIQQVLTEQQVLKDGLLLPPSERRPS